MVPKTVFKILGYVWHIIYSFVPTKDVLRCPYNFYQGEREIFSKSGITPCVNGLSHCSLFFATNNKIAYWMALCFKVFLSVIFLTSRCESWMLHVNRYTFWQLKYGSQKHMSLSSAKPQESHRVSYLIHCCQYMNMKFGIKNRRIYID